MKTEIKEFIKEQHAEACSEWKVKIEEKFSELFKSEIEVGKWYYRGDELVVWNDRKLTYGFSANGIWNDSMLCSISRGLTPATDKEVEDALIAEAKRRGFKKGVNFINTTGRKVNCFNTLEACVDYNKNLGVCFGDGNGLIFYNGKWATIIEEEMISLNEVRKKIQIIENKLQSLKELLK